MEQAQKSVGQAASAAAIAGIRPAVPQPRGPISLRSFARPKLIALVGAESTGKTALAEALAQRLGSLYVPEFLREFVQAHARTPTCEEQAGIMLAQAQREDAALQQAQALGLPYVFCDASTLMTAVYSEYVFGDQSLFAPADKLHRRYGLTLLLNNDLEWQANGIQRDGPHVRAPVFRLIHQQLHRLQQPYFLVCGVDEWRLHTALFALGCVQALSAAPSS